VTTKKAPEETGTEVVHVAEVVKELVKREGDVLGKWLAHEAENTETDPTAVYEAIIAEIMSAETIEDLLNLPEPGNLSDHVDQVLEIYGFRVLDSEFQQGAKVYFVFGGQNLTTGEKFVVTCGEQAVMAQLLRAKQLDAFPIRTTPTQATRPNKYGKRPMRLKAPGGSRG
jgi:hypothetical protein